ncbi:polysaccharide pyruvyl transferase family protein [Paenibacillus sp. GCM10023248]|nr:polysaccharide pyruvyl transferase family protein [Paenibacillus sp. MAHUQ-63]
MDIYLAFNLGDDLFLDILAKKYPNCDFTVNHLGGNYDQFISQYNNVRRREYTLLDKISRRLKFSDPITSYDKIASEHEALIFIGGSIFREEQYHEALYQDRMKMVLEFKKLNKPVFILGANFGPFETEQFYNDYKELFKICDDVCFRDLYSYELFRALPQVRYAPDIVFQMNVDEYKATSTREVIGFSIINVRHKQGLSKYYDDYMTSTTKSIELMVSKGYECCLMSFCEREGDLETIEAIKSLLPNETLRRVTIYEYKGNLKEAIQLMASCKLFIAARFHANILALLLGVGVMPIIYSSKTTNMLKDINFDGYLINMEEIQLQYDEQHVNRSFRNKANLAQVSIKAKNQFERLTHFINAV